MKKNLIKMIKNKWKWLLAIISLICFVMLGFFILKDNSLKLDEKGYSIISSLLINDKLTPIVRCITNFGGVIFIVSWASILTIMLKNKKIVLAIWINLAITTCLNQIIKHIIQRPRPEGFRLIEENGYSFPSGHSMVSMAFYGLLMYLIFKYVQNKKMRYIGISVLGLIIAIIGISRIYLGVHYTSDVLAGFLLSIAYLFMYIAIINKTLLAKK